MPSIVQIAGVSFPIMDYDSAIRKFKDWIGKGTSHQVCIANVHTLVTAMRTPAYLTIMRKAAMVTMDGQPLRWYANAVCGSQITDRVCGPELMLRCLQQGIALNWRHYLLGGRPEVLEMLQIKLHQQLPGVKLVGGYSPPFRLLSSDEDSRIVEEINKSNADFLWVGLGAPRQEQWIYHNLHRLNVPVCLGVGAAFDFHAGFVRRAPHWMQSFGLEWLYRASVDLRLFRRYLDTNPTFIWMLLRDWIRVRLLKCSDICGHM